ncbi:MAG: hypothetical protein JNL95_06225 [Chitinophagales bacterium]|nr:hypothetical protein [Chitinophagales bacterium]
MDEIKKNQNLNNPKPVGETPEGFGKGVNDYFNHYVTVADAKAGAILAANFILLGGLIDISLCDCILVPYLLSGIASIASIIFCGIVLYPRLAKAEKGFIFWENIKSYNSINEYLNDVRQLDIPKVEEEYAMQNWHVSKILSSKNKYVRIAITLFIISLIFFVVTFLLKKL